MNMKTLKRNERLPAWLAAMMITGLCLGGVRPVAAATDTWNGGATPDGTAAVIEVEAGEIHARLERLK